MIYKINVSECVKMWYFQQKIRKIFWGGGTAPPQTLPPVGREMPLDGREMPLLKPTPLGACGISTPPILKFWVRH